MSCLISGIPKPGQWCVVDDDDGPKDGWWWQHPVFNSKLAAVRYCEEHTEACWIARVVKVRGGWTLEDWQGPYRKEGPGIVPA